MDIICSFMIIFSTIILPLCHWAGNLGLTPKDRWVTRPSTMVSCIFVLRRKATTNRVIDPVDFTDEVLVEHVDSYLSNACFPIGNALCVSLTDVSGPNHLFIFTLFCMCCMSVGTWAHVCHCMYACGSQRTDCGRDSFSMWPLRLDSCLRLDGHHFTHRALPWYVFRG